MSSNKSQSDQDLQWIVNNLQDETVKEQQNQSNPDLFQNIHNYIQENQDQLFQQDQQNELLEQQQKNQVQEILTQLQNENKNEEIVQKQENVQKQEIDENKEEKQEIVQKQEIEENVQKQEIVQKQVEQYMKLKKEGDELFIKRKYNQAIESYNESIEENKNDQKCLISCNINISMCYFQNKKYPLSIKYLDKVQKIQKNEFKSLYRLAVTHRIAGNIQKAYEYIQEASKIDYNFCKLQLGEIQKLYDELPKNIQQPQNAKQPQNIQQTQQQQQNNKQTQIVYQVENKEINKKIDNNETNQQQITVQQNRQLNLQQKIIGISTLCLGLTIMTKQKDGSRIKLIGNLFLMGTNLVFNFYNYFGRSYVYSLTYFIPGLISLFNIY